MPATVFAVGSLVVALLALVLLFRLLRQVRLLRNEAEALEAYSLEQEKEIVRLQRSLPFDGITGLGNTVRLGEDWSRLVARYNRRGEPFSITLIDVEDQFDASHVPDRASLAMIAASLLETVRVEDHVYRLGQQRFAVLLSGSDAEGARAFLDRARRTLETKRQSARPGANWVMVSGVAAWDKSLETLDSFLQLAQEDRDAHRASIVRNRIAARLGRVRGPKTMSAADLVASPHP